MGIFGRRRKNRVKDLTAQLAQSEAESIQAMSEVVHFHEDRDRLALELAQIRGCLAQVAVYEGLVDSSPLAMMVSELVRDHEELEARIDAAMHVISGIGRQEADLSASGNEVSSAGLLLINREGLIEVGRLLQGGKRVPDDLSDLSI